MLKRSLFFTAIFISFFSFWYEAALATAEENERKLRIYFVSPSPDDGRFWYVAHNFARAAARDLNIDFKIFYSENGNRRTYLMAYEKAFNAPEKPDYIIGTFFRSIGVPVFQMAQKKNIPVFMVNSNIPLGEEKEIGHIRGKYQNFIGHMAPDEQHTGYLLAKKLIERAKQKTAGSKVNIVGVSGHPESPVATNRINGLLQAVEEDDNTNLVQVVFTNWTTKDALSRVKGLLRRYDSANAFWFATDDMALVAAKHFETRETELVVGGVDWKKEAIQAIKWGRLEASIGGHFTEVGYALVLLYDHFHGLDFSSQFSEKINTTMTIITQNNVAKYHKFLTEQNWDRIDFHKFSKVLSPNLEKYDFSFNALVQATK